MFDIRMREQARQGKQKDLSKLDVKSGTMTSEKALAKTKEIRLVHLMGICIWSNNMKMLVCLVHRLNI
jgi:hypothetical protein